MPALFSVIIVICFSFLKAEAQTDQTFSNGTITPVINFPSGGCVYNWTNNNPAIGLPVSGTGNISSFTATNTGNSPITASITATPVLTGLAYITNAGDNSVSVINIGTNTVVKTIPVGGHPTFLTSSPDGSHLYVVNGFANTISEIDAASNSVITTFNTGALNEIVMSPDGAYIYMADYGSESVDILNTSTNVLVATIPLSATPGGITINADGSRLYVANSNLNMVYVINTASKQVIKTIAVHKNPIQVLLSPNGSRLYVTNNGSNNVSVINTGNNTVIATITTGASPDDESLSPDGSQLYVTNFHDNTVSVINTSSNIVTATINVKSNPLGISVSPDGSSVYVVNQGSNNVSVINASTNTVFASNIAVGSLPGEIFILKGAGCSPVPIKFTITVNPSPTITTSTASGNITACAGNVSEQPNVEQFTVSGSYLISNLTLTAPANFEISLTLGAGYAKSLTLTPSSGGTVNNTIIYVRSAATAPAGNLAGNVRIASAGATSERVAVTGSINTGPAVDAVNNQTVTNGQSVQAINFTGSANEYSWVNDTPGIGLPASGTGNIAAFTAINNSRANITATITVTPVNNTAFAYVANSTSGTVSVISTSTNTIVANIPVGNTPFGISVSPDGSHVYVSNQEGNTISVISTSTNTITGTITTAANPLSMAFSPDATKLYVAYGELNNIVSVVDVATNAVTATFPTGVSFYGFSVSRDGKYLYGVDATENLLWVIDAATGTTITRIFTAYHPYGLVSSPDGKTLYVTNQSPGSVSVINTASNTVTGTIDVVSQPLGIAISPDGSLLYVTSQISNTVSVINTSTNSVIAVIPVGMSPIGVSVSSDGSRVYVLNYSSNNASVIDAATNAVIATIQNLAAPEGFGNFISPGSGCTGMPATFTVTVKPSPGISAAGILQPLTTVYGTPSAAESFTVSGSGLTAGILVTPPNGFEVSNDNSTFGSNVTVGAAGTVASATVYIRLAAGIPVNTYAGNIVLSSAGLSSVNVAMPNSTVTPAGLTITADDVTKLYGTLLTGGPGSSAFVSSGLQNSETIGSVTIVYGAGAAADAAIGTYTGSVTPSAVTGGTFLASNYTISYVAGNITVTGNNAGIVIPNTFSPNGDGINDTWDIKNLETYPKCSVNIFNREGKNIYSSIGYGTPWNGTHNNSQIASGTYYYIIKLGPGQKSYAGYVVVFR